MKSLTAVWMKPIRAMHAWRADLTISIYEESDTMQKESYGQLCPNCRTGKETYLLDKTEPTCPFIQLHNANGCVKYSPLVKTEE